MKKTVKELLNEYENEYNQVDIYAANCQEQYFKMHTDCLDSLYGNDTCYTDPRQFEDCFAIEWSLMDEEEYNNTVLANTGSRFDDFYEKNDRVLVIVLEEHYSDHNYDYWLYFLRHYEYREISSIIRFGFSSDDLGALHDLYMNDEYRAKLDSLLTDCNYHKVLRDWGRELEGL